MSKLIDNPSGGTGGGSVTSNELSATAASLSTRINSVQSAVSTAISAIQANSAQMKSADDAISNAVSAVSARVDVVSNALSAKRLISLADVSGTPTSAQQMVWWNSAAGKFQFSAAPVGGAGSVTSTELSAVSAAAESANGTLSVRINSVQSSLSTAVSAIAANSAQMTSADNAISNAVSVVSVAAANALSVANAASNAASIVSVVAANATSIANAVSNALSAKRLISLADVSGTPTSAKPAIVWNSAAAKFQFSAQGGGGSVTSAELNAVSADAASANGVLSGRIDSVIAATSNNVSIVSQYASVVSVYADNVSNYASVVSNYASVVSATAAGLPVTEIRIVSNVQSTNGSALVDLSGLVLTMSAGESWEINGIVLVSTSVATAGLRMGCSVTPLSSPRHIRFMRASGTQSAGILAGGGQLQVSGTSQFFSAANLGALINMIEVKAVLNCASSGTFRLQACGIASTAASPLHFMPGSYLRCVKLK